MFIEAMDGEVGVALGEEAGGAGVLGARGAAGEAVFIVERERHAELAGFIEGGAVGCEVVVAEVGGGEVVSEGEDAESAVEREAFGLLHLVADFVGTNGGIIPEPERSGA